MKLSLKQYLIILVIILIASTGFLGYQLLQANERARSLEAAVKIYEKDFEAIREENFRLMDSLKQLRKLKDQEITTRQQKITDLLAVLDSILNSETNEENIDHINDPDSLQRLFARYYPDHRSSGEGRD